MVGQAARGSGIALLREAGGDTFVVRRVAQAQPERLQDGAAVHAAVRSPCLAQVRVGYRFWYVQPQQLRAETRDIPRARGQFVGDWKRARQSPVHGSGDDPCQVFDVDP